MTKHRIKAKVDSNQPQIVKELRKCGYTVELDKDDIIVGKNGITLWIEIKNGSPFRKDGKLKPNPDDKQGIQTSQYKILCTWQGQYNICWETEHILNANLYCAKPSVVGISPAMFRINYKKWLTINELNRLRQMAWWNLD